MSQTTLTDLAPELLILIFKSSDCFADVTALSSTSRKMFTIWKTNLDVICEAILARTVPHYAEALELADAQKKAGGDELFGLSYQTGVERAQWMLKGAECAARTVDEAFFSQERGIKTLTPAPRMRFIQIYYRAATIAALGTDPLPSRLMSSWNMLDLEQVHALVQWMGLYSYAYDQRSFDPARGVSPSNEKWKKVYDALSYLIADLYRYEGERGPLLADLFVLVRQKSANHNIFYSLSEE